MSQGPQSKSWCLKLFSYCYGWISFRSLFPMTVQLASVFLLQVSFRHSFFWYTLESFGTEEIEIG